MYINKRAMQENELKIIPSWDKFHPTQNNLFQQVCLMTLPLLKFTDVNIGFSTFSFSHFSLLYAIFNNNRKIYNIYLH